MPEFIGATLLNEGPSLRPENLTTLHTILSALSSEDITFEHVLTDPIDRFLKAHEEHFKDDDIPTKSEHNAKPPPLKRSQSSPSLSSKETTIDEVLRLAKLIKLKLSRLNTSEFERPDDPGSASPSRPRSAANPLPPPSADSTFASPPSPSSAGSPFTSPSSPPSAGSPLASQLAGLGVNNVSPDQLPQPPKPNKAKQPQSQAQAAVQPGGGAPALDETPPGGATQAPQRPQSAPLFRTAPPVRTAPLQPGKAGRGRPAWEDTENTAAQDHQRPQAAATQRPQSAPQGRSALAPQTKVEAAPGEAAPDQPVEAALGDTPAQQGEPAQERLRTRVARAKELNHEQKNFLDNIENLTVNPDLSSGQISITDIPTSRRSIKTETIRLTANDISKIYDELKKSSLKAHVKLEKNQYNYTF